MKNDFNREPSFKIVVGLLFMACILSLVLLNVSNTSSVIASICFMMVAFYAFVIIAVILGVRTKYEDENKINFLKAYISRYASYNGLKGCSKLVEETPCVEERESSKRKIDIIANVIFLMDTIFLGVALILFLALNRNTIFKFDAKNIEFITSSVFMIIMLAVFVWIPFLTRRKSLKSKPTVVECVFSSLDNKDNMDVIDKRIFKKRLFCEIKQNEVIAFAMVSIGEIHMYFFDERGIENLKVIRESQDSIGHEDINEKISNFFSNVKKQVKTIEYNSENYVLEEIEKMIDELKKYNEN